MKNPIIRTIYLYLFTLVGLGMLVIGSARMVDLALKSWVFTKADQNYYGSEIVRPPSFYLGIDRERGQVEEILTCSDKCELNEEQKQALANWLDDYDKWHTDEENRDPKSHITARRQRQASSSLSMILIGLPLYLFHWGVIKRDKKKVA